MTNLTFDELSGIPPVDFPTNLRTALAAGRRVGSILKEVIQLRSGTGKLTPNEYFYYRLWEDRLTARDKASFIGKQAQHPMHMACNDTGWYAAAADKLLFQTIMTGAGLPLPTLLATTGKARSSAEAIALVETAETEAFLRDETNYPLFIKPVDGKYSLSVMNADGYEPQADRIYLRGAGRRPVEQVAAEMAERKAGYLVQRRLEPDETLQALFGPALWSVRILVLMTQEGPVIHRAVAKIATGENPADNFWRRGNMLGAIDSDTGLITRVVQGAGSDMMVNKPHPDTKRAVVGAEIPHWSAVKDLVATAARVLPGIRTQSWDVALTDAGPVLLEVNFGGDLNLAQIAHGNGVLDDRFTEHLKTCGYRI